MSHLPQRTEKNCLNCGTEVQGRYCQNCGQENLHPKETFWHLITHFFNDFTHFDGKFFSTVKYMILKPGFLTLEYMRGRRQSYLHPIRMYVFTSALFFIIFFSIYEGNDLIQDGTFNIGDSATWSNAQKIALSEADTHEDSMAIIQGFKNPTRGYAKMDTIDLRRTRGISFSIDTSDFKTVEQYDSVQKALPAEKRDGWLRRKFARKTIELNKEYNSDPRKFWNDVLNKFLHQFPKLFFISLPLFALILKLLYIRRKQFYYADHWIFTIHLYIFSYIFFLVFFGVSALSNAFPAGVWGWIQFALWLYWLLYTYKAMRRFYQQRRFKTIVKYLLLNFSALIIMLILFILFFGYTVLYM